MNWDDGNADIKGFKGSKVFWIEVYMIYSNSFICENPFNPFYQRSIFLKDGFCFRFAQEKKE